MSENIVCICKGISEETIVKAIKEGATSVEAIKEKTGALTGPCQGARCIGKIEQLIENNK